MTKNRFSKMPPRLLSGYLVRFANGQYGIVMCFDSTYYIMHTSPSTTRMQMRNVKQRYNDELKHKYCADWNIDTIIRPTCEGDLKPTKWIDAFAMGRGVIWKREKRLAKNIADVIEAAAKTFGVDAELLDVIMPDNSTLRVETSNGLPKGTPYSRAIVSDNEIGYMMACKAYRKIK